MTVQRLIDLLNKIEDKSQELDFYAQMSRCEEDLDLYVEDEPEYGVRPIFCNITGRVTFLLTNENPYKE